MSEILEIYRRARRQKFRLTTPDGTRRLLEQHEVKDQVNYLVEFEKMRPEDMTLEVMIWQPIDWDDFMMFDKVRPISPIMES